MSDIRAWARQPSSIAGLAAICGAISALLTHQLSWAQATPVLVGALVSVALPDNTQAKTEAVGLTAAIVSTVYHEQGEKI